MKMLTKVNMRTILNFMNYSTHQKSAVLSFFSSNSDSSYSLGEVSEKVTDVGKSTIYRIVGALEKENIIRKVGRDKRGDLYQYSDREKCPRHMHIRCIKCGKTEHLDESVSSQISALINSSVGYSETLGTVFLGLCPTCDKEKI